MEGSAPTRTRPMEVLSLGMCRTGTESMRRALTRLGYGYVYHANTTMERPHHNSIWAELVERTFGPQQRSIEREHFDQILCGCSAVTDCPCVAYWEELMDTYPEAKIVLVEREVETWFRSFKAVVLDEVLGWAGGVLMWATDWGLIDASPYRMNERIMFGTFRANSPKEMEANAKVVYWEHYEKVAAKADQEGRALLRMRLEDGWGPLCKFLGKEVPGEKFPRGNEQVLTIAVIRRVQNGLLRQLGGAVLKRVLVVSLTIVVVGLLMKHAWR